MALNTPGALVPTCELPTSAASRIVFRASILLVSAVALALRRRAALVALAAGLARHRAVLPPAEISHISTSAWLRTCLRQIVYGLMKLLLPCGKPPEAGNTLHCDLKERQIALTLGASNTGVTAVILIDRCLPGSTFVVK